MLHEACSGQICYMIYCKCVRHSEVFQTETRDIVLYCAAQMCRSRKISSTDDLFGLLETRVCSSAHFEPAFAWLWAFPYGWCCPLSTQLRVPCIHEWQDSRKRWRKWQLCLQPLSGSRRLSEAQNTTAQCRLGQRCAASPEISTNSTVIRCNSALWGYCWGV